MSKLGTYLKKLRLLKGLSQKDVAKALGIALKTYYNYERGYHLPRINTLLKIAEFFAKNEQEKEKIYKEMLNFYSLEQQIEKRETREVFFDEEKRESLLTFSKLLLHDVLKEGYNLNDFSEVTGISLQRLQDVLFAKSAPTTEELKIMATTLKKPVERYLAILSDLSQEYFSYFLRNKQVKNFFVDLYKIPDQERQKVLKWIKILINSYLKSIEEVEEGLE